MKQLTQDIKIALGETGFVTNAVKLSRNDVAPLTLRHWLNNPFRFRCRQSMKTTQSGFTLLEVLIALAVLALLMMGLLKISAANAQNLWYLENKALAATIAANHAAEMRLQDQQQESADGWDEMAGRRWHWQADRLVMSPLDGVQRYRIDVSLQDDPQPYASLIIDLADKS